MTRYRLTLAALLGGAVLAAGCSSGSGGPGVASVSSATPSGTSSPTGSVKDRALAYSQCMRSHGITDFPDPNSDGQIQLEAHPGSDLDPNSARFKAALQACKSLEPTAPPQEQAKQHAAALKYSQCMRDHGIKDFPDPNPQGGIQISAAPGSDLMPDSPLFKAADKACASLRGDKGAPGGSMHTGGKS
ncbi:MAG TPA: hypothetical protein VGL39_13285 [Jatrophihabitantaceae bacterium]|jgi:hypothetical protein